MGFSFTVPAASAACASVAASAAFASACALRSALSCSAIARSAARSAASVFAAFASLLMPLVHSTGAIGKQTEQRISPSSATASASVLPDSSVIHEYWVVMKQVEQFRLR